MSATPEPLAPPVTETDVRACAEVLEAIAQDRGLLADLAPDLRLRLLVAAGRVSRPEKESQRALNRAFRRQDRAERREADARALAATGIREARGAPVFATPGHRTEVCELRTPGVLRGAPELREPRTCYICKQPYRRLHAFYDQLCPGCGDFNYEKRLQSAPLDGRLALVTGGRVKIGYQAAVKLLRAGAHVVVTTRFPRDAAARYAREVDFERWRDRLEVYGLDLRHTPSVEVLALHLGARLPRLDFILHNACQTVRRPPGFYAHLLEAEAAPLAAVPEPARPLVAGYEVLRARGAGPSDAALLTQVPLSAEDTLLLGRGDLFPAGRLDADLQQVDLRERNSWRLPLAEVPTVEVLEVHLVNAVAPFVLSARLKPLMLRHPRGQKHIVNVSAMEGQFARAFKTDKHPHTNMAKAALNMLTRTSAQDYARDGIHMNSVDTGWVTDEDPAAIAARKARDQGYEFEPPLDIVDGAARICDPIFSGLNTGVHAWGKFFKDYREVPW